VQSLPRISSSALVVLKHIQFPTTQAYMCEVEFSRYTKAKYRMNVSSDTRIQLSNIFPNFWLSCDKIKLTLPNGKLKCKN
jgi:hypothetical protein